MLERNLPIMHSPGYQTAQIPQASVTAHHSSWPAPSSCRRVLIDAQMAEIWESIGNVLHKPWLDHGGHSQLQLLQVGRSFQAVEQHIQVHGMVSYVHNTPL